VEKKTEQLKNENLHCFNFLVSFFFSGVFSFLLFLDVKKKTKSIPILDC